MNSKELLEQADQRIAENEKIKTARVSIADMDCLLSMLDDNMMVLSFFDSDTKNNTPICTMMDASTFHDFKELTRSTFKRYLSVQAVKLEQLLGLKPKILNPEFEAAVRDMESANKPDPVEDKLAEIIQRQEQEIKSKPVPEDKPLDKYPAKRGRQSSRPESMTLEAVRKMYLDENKDIHELASHFGVTESIVKNFLFRNQIKRKVKVIKQPAETERP